MQLEYENGTLCVENASGLRWQQGRAQKPRFSFDYDALSVTPAHALRRIGSDYRPLVDTELEQVKAYIEQLPPPAGATLHKQIMADLRAFANGLIGSLVSRLDFDSLLDVTNAGREGSTDLRAGEARRVLAFADAVWNAFRGLAERIVETPERELNSVSEYANMMPFPPDTEFFTGSAACLRHASKERDAAIGACDTPRVPSSTVRSIPHAVSVGIASKENSDLSNMLDRVFVYDDFFSSTQLELLEQWAFRTPHWMLTNSARDEHGRVQHRIWGASFIEAWQRHGWGGIPPVLYAAVGTVFQELEIAIPTPEYIGLNGQARGQDASVHVDCARDAPDQLSILLYIGEDTNGDLVLYDKEERQRSVGRIAFRPNRVVALDGSIPHQALAPNDDGFRVSAIIRGTYTYQAGR